MKNEIVTSDWLLYEAGLKYNNSKNILQEAKVNTEFYEGNQWVGAKDTTLPKPMFNIIKRVGDYFVASLTSSPIKAFMTPLLFENFDKEVAAKSQNAELIDMVNAIDVANATLTKIYERNKFQDKIRDAVTRAAKTGDMAFHIKFNTNLKPYVYAPKSIYKGDIEIEVEDGVNIFFGNANIHEVEKQPYILVAGRDTVENLNKERKTKNGLEVERDDDTDNFIRHDYEVEADKEETNQATYIIKYFKKKDKNGNVKIYANKSTKNVVIYENMDTGLTRYPIAFGNWNRQTGCYHGKAMASGMIPNQIFINRMWAMWQYALQLNAFPKAIYNASRISQWSSAIGTAIPVNDNGEPNFNINNMAKYIEPPQMSTQVVQALNECMAQTKDMLGISDATLGNVNPTNTSAIVAIQKSAAVPLKNQQANLYEFVEDTTMIVLDMIANKYGIRDVAVDLKSVNMPNAVTQYDFSQLKDLALSLDISIGEGNYYDEIAQVQTLDNLLQMGQITLVQYLERVPDSIIPKRMELLKEVQTAAQMQMGMPTPPQVSGSIGGQISTNQTNEELLKAMQSQSGLQQLQTMQQMS